ncbi:MAG: threonine--tRNA ligase, partial [Patescibacteria group bacterium]
MKQKDHRQIGKELGIFHISPDVGIGLPLWLPNGTIVRKALMDFLEKEQVEAGYKFVSTPHLGKFDLYKKSGHWDTYRKNMYQPIEIDKEKYILKPMNCPHHIAIYESEIQSYRDLPLRLAEYGTVYRYEQSGELMGLTRTRGFTIDDAHIFLAEDDLKNEFENVLALTKKVFSKFDFHDFKARVGLRGESEKYVGSNESWEKAENAIRNVMEKSDMKYSEEKGEAAFYGPKLDFLVKDNLGREWQLGTIQVDYNLPERFDLKYTAQGGAKQRPVMIHRAPFGSLERFVAILLEHFQGKLPIWLSPVQIAIIPVSEKFDQEARELAGQLKPVRAKVMAENDTVGKRVSSAKKQMIPFVLVYGEKEK